ncbi:hypothetical protein ABZ468_42515 [Streptomyces sp. NPDC005708]|uniref:hypothetical protein n=1 Tax=unclassified Streptomyces TaxID=2593676 RepID=UPI0033C8830B
MQWASIGAALVQVESAWRALTCSDAVTCPHTVAVVVTAFGQYGGAWAHHGVRTSVGAAVLACARLFIPGSVTRFADTHRPADDSDVVEGVTRVIQQLSQAGTAAV